MLLNWSILHNAMNNELALSEHFIRYLLVLFFILINYFAAVAAVRGLMCCVFRDALLHTTFVICGYLH